MHHVAAAVHHTSQFWPTLGRVGTALTTIGAGVATWYGRKNHSINVEIKTAVNGEFAAKVQDLANVTEKLKQMTAARDAAVAANSNQGASDEPA
jgi:hypothetical protein